MNHSRGLKIRYALGLLLVCAGAVVVILGSRWPGLVLVAAGAAVYFPASSEIKGGQAGSVQSRPMRRLWGAAAAVLIAVALGLLAGPTIRPPKHWRLVFPAALVAIGALAVWTIWRSARRHGTDRSQRSPGDVDPGGRH